MRRTGTAERWAFGQHRLGLATGVVTIVVTAWGLARSALWLDEGATVVATQRTWSDLWTLGEGAETPLLPYYVALKLFAGVARTLAPALEHHPEILFRLPSVIVTVLAAWLLAAWASRLAPPRLVVAAGTMLLACSGFSRYGQEARPYAAVLFLAVVATVLWTTLADDPRPRWLVAYALSLTAMVVMHTFSAGLAGAHVLAALVCLPAGRRGPVFWRTAGAGAVGVMLAAPAAVLSSRNGTGPLYVYPDVTPHDALTVFVRLFTLEESPLLGLGPVLILALAGLFQVRPGPFSFIARLAACWAVVPLLAMVPVLVVHPNLLFERYVLFVVPAWALLAGLGVVTLADLVPTRLGAVSALTLLLAGTLALQAGSHREIRQEDGHSEDVRPVLALASQPPYADLPIVSSSRFGSVEIGAYAQADEHRLVTHRVQRDETAIWPAAVPETKARRLLQHHDQVILLQRANSDPGCEQARVPVPVEEIERCQPDLLKKLGFRVQRLEPSGTGWVFALMTRPDQQ
ncbi:glycosyltransferase family 39 protein [Kineosporia succinea]|uniref:Mannosyltransferase n=1 Tax=Kineosporia succinea TaxID=84632 RepID=A0ABT9PE71_9ACTN|nr:glycosyltransferase family 39 protein [Kineosporia succinea]MDP9831004.1 mannosyltransferase [Kineosporia succinea]